MQKTAIVLIVCLLAFLLISADFPYDPEAQIDMSLNNTVQFGYLVLLFENNPFIYFRDKDNPADNLAQYNWKQQYWLYKTNGFNDGGIKLEKFFKKINLAKTNLYRNLPEADTTVVKTAAEDKPYDFANDMDFKGFHDYLVSRGTAQEVLDFYLKAANNPAKRGKSVPFEYGAVYSVSETGIQPEHFKLYQYKNLTDGEAMRKTPMITAGGMQLYFELHNQKYIRAVDWALNIFKDNKKVPVLIVELEPVEGMTGPPVLRGKNLVKRVKADLEAFFKKPFLVKQTTMTISYTDFAANGEVTPLTHYDRFFDLTVHKKIPANTLVIYYFTDSARLRVIDPDLSHPLYRGPYGSDWENKYTTILHEFGHSLGLRHHFNEEGTGSADINTHISPACIMNYRFSKNEFCELCLYALGVE